MTKKNRQGGETSQGPPNTVNKVRVPLIRCGVGGVLMGLANLVPGVSGGTMILIMGLYDEFISAVADATRFRFTRRGVVFLGVVVVCAVVTVVSLARPLARLVVLYPGAMYALFIGMTLGGVPLLWRMMRPVRGGPVLAMAAGIALMLTIAAAKSDGTGLSKEEKTRIKEMVRKGEFQLRSAYGLDVAAGVLGMSAMVLPGISGAYMLLLLGRYEQILGAIGLTKEYALSLGKAGDPAALHVIVPVAIGALVSLVGVTNVLKWFLHHHDKPTVGLLLGVLVGSVVMLWPMVEAQASSEYAVAGILLVVGFGVTVWLSRIGAKGGVKRPSSPRVPPGAGE